MGTAEAEGGRKDEAVRPEEVSEGPRWAVAAEFMPKDLVRDRVRARVRVRVRVRGEGKG